MRDVTLTQVFDHHITQKYINRSGMAHAIRVAYHAYALAINHKVDVDLATKAAFLHDIGHYTWYKNGKWDYSLYKAYDIHPIKGAERAHKLLIRLGEHPKKSKRNCHCYSSSHRFTFTSKSVIFNTASTNCCSSGYAR